MIILASRDYERPHYSKHSFSYCPDSSAAGDHSIQIRTVTNHRCKRLSNVVWKAVVDVPCNLQRVVEKKACHWLHSTTRCRIFYNAL